MSSPSNHREAEIAWKDSWERMDAERKHLEGLLKDRIDFYLVFAGLFFAGLYHLDEPIKGIGLVAGTIVSFILLLAIIRTFRLVCRALKDIEKKIGSIHPYVRYCEDLWLPPNANWLLVSIPTLLTCLLAWLSLPILSAWLFWRHGC